MPIIIKGAGISAIVALVLALLMIVVLELMRPTRLGVTATGDDAETLASPLVDVTGVSGATWESEAGGHANGHHGVPARVDSAGRPQL